MRGSRSIDALGGAALVALAASASGAATAAPYPLDALSPQELERAVAILKDTDRVDDASRFALLTLQEPDKAEVLAWKPGEPFGREALAVIKQGPKVYEAVIDLGAGEVASFEEVPGIQPGVLIEEWQAAQEITVADPGWLAAMAKRGFAAEGIGGRVFCMPLSPGYFAIPEFEGRRLLNVQCADRRGSVRNLYGRPIEGLTAIVDLNERRVVRLVDEGVVPVAEAAQDYDEASVALLQPAPKPTRLHQPEGSNVELDGSVVRWNNWSFHLRLDRRRGTMVSLARFDDGGRERDVLYQGSLSEVFVPYMDPAPGWAYKSYMDAGEYGFGLFATALEAGTDCPTTATFLDATLALDDGAPAPFDDAICLFERYAGDPAWRHADVVNRTHESRPRVDLVARMIATVGNYDYVMDWIFTKDGAIGVEVGATGIAILKGVAAKSMADPTAAQDAAYGTLVAPNVVAPLHDHFFSFRLDFDVDGTRNSFVDGRLVTTPLPPENYRRSIWTLQNRMPMTEKEARLRLSYEHPAVWHVMSSEAMNAVGNPTSYMLMPGGNAASLLLPEDWPLKRAAFAQNHLWVTPYDPKELYAGGNYPNQGKGGDGLAAWTEADRPIHDADIVLWYTLGFHHVTAAEDLPVLNVHKAGFWLKPMNFFDRNPAINLPKPRETAAVP